MRKVQTSTRTTTQQHRIDARDVDLPEVCSEVWRISRRGSRPSWIAWRVSEKAPVITAWLAMIVATVAMMTSGRMKPSGASL